MDTCKLFELAKPYLEKNDFGLAHTQRVLEIAKKNFPVKPELEELTYTAIIFHDIGGCTIKDQYEKGPQITTSILKSLGLPNQFINDVCKIISTHHEHPQNPSESFKALYDSDKLVMFSPEEFPHYNAREDFDWDKVVSLIYSDIGQDLAKKALAQRRKENEKR
jgi:predicted metal-dependent HD superfamily phosphohydrolase